LLTTSLLLGVVAAAEMTQITVVAVVLADIAQPLAISLPQELRTQLL
jgi:hypothetical protein